MPTFLHNLYTRLTWFYNTPSDEREVLIYQQASKKALKHFFELLFISIAGGLFIDVAWWYDFFGGYLYLYIVLFELVLFQSMVFVGGVAYIKNHLTVPVTTFAVIRLSAEVILLGWFTYLLISGF
ncbi:MAG: hypothetical protein ACD_43C00241G0004 [uncultured bacterium]|nr:MAG: hypothetical protein ACD_43C00241G0004 [uncultured bacterium]